MRVHVSFICDTLTELSKIVHCEGSRFTLTLKTPKLIVFFKVISYSVILGSIFTERFFMNYLMQGFDWYDRVSGIYYPMVGLKDIFVLI